MTVAPTTCTNGKQHIRYEQEHECLRCNTLLTSDDIYEQAYRNPPTRTGGENQHKDDVATIDEWGHAG